MEREQLITHIDKKIEEADKNLNDCIKELATGKNLMEEINFET